MKRMSFLLGCPLFFVLCAQAMAADVAGKYVMKNQEATSIMTVTPVENRYKVVIDAKSPLLNEDHTMHASLLDAEASLHNNAMDIVFRPRDDDPSSMRDPEKTYTISITFGDKSAVVREIAGHRDAILNTPFGSVDIQGSYVKEEQAEIPVSYGK